MADIIYTYHNQVYMNITNKCDCCCQFCIRSHRDQVGEADNLCFQSEPTSAFKYKWSGKSLP